MNKDLFNKINIAGSIKSFQNTDDAVFAYDSADFIQTRLFEFCGCGSPKENIRFICNGLKIIDELRNISGKISINNHTPYDEWIKKEKELFKTDDISYFFYYWADKEGLTEHGGCVPGWLTEDGKKVIKLIEEVLLETDI